MENKETLEEVALKLYPRLINDPYNPLEDDNKEERDIWINGTKWQAEQDENKFSEEEIRFIKGMISLYWMDNNSEHPMNFKEVELSKSIIKKIR